MEGYADPSTAAQDAMVNMLRCEILKHLKKQKVEKSFRTYFKYFVLFFPFFDILDSMGSMSAEDRRAQKHATNDSLHQESAAVVDG